MLVNGFKEDSLDEFIKKQTIFQKKITFGYDQLWTAIKDVVFEGEKYFALPRNFPPAILKEYLYRDEMTVVKAPEFYIKYRDIQLEMKPGVKPRDDLQLDVLDFLHGRNRYKENAKKPRRAVFADTDSGKTFTTIKYISDTGLAPVIICPDDRAIKTWLEEFAKFTEIKPEEIGIVKGQDSIPGVVKRKDKIKVVLISNRTVSFMFKEKKDQALLDFFETMQFGLKVYDELHMGLETIFYMEMTLVSYRTFYLTATNSKRIYGEQKTLDFMTPSEDCVFQPPPAPKFEYMEVQYFTNPKVEHTKGINKPNGFDALTYLAFLINVDYPYGTWFLDKVIRKIMNFCLKNISDDTNKIAILTKTNVSGEYIGKYIEQQFPNLTVGYFNSKTATKMDDRMPETEKNVIISTDKSFAGILNIPRLEIIVNVTPVTSEAHIKQIAGRLRKELDKRRIFVQLGDASFKKARNMLYRERKIMEKVSISMDKVQVGKPTHPIEEDE
jgi:hypothetical protein